MIEIFVPGDLAAIVLTPEHREFADAAGPLLKQLSELGFAWTSTVEGGHVLAIIGARPADVDDCEVFIFPSATLVKRNPFTLFKDISTKLAHARARFKVVRSVTRPDAPQAHRFLAHLGFVREGKRGDYLMWVLR